MAQGCAPAPDTVPSGETSVRKRLQRRGRRREAAMFAPLLADHVPAVLRRARSLLGLPGGPATELADAEIPAAARAVEALHEGLIGARRLARFETYRGSHLGAYLL